jgi:hemerythrin-like domain-containing protein
MSDVFDILRADHREVQQMLTELEGGPTQANRATPLRPEARKQLTEKLVIESSKHEVAEEEYFWPTVRDRLPDGDQLADHAIDQETAAKQVLARLEQLSPGDAEFEKLLSRYIPAAREHIDYEEDVVWPTLREVLTAAEAENLGKDITIAKGIAPTRPHPRIPAQPDVLKTAGPAVAAADKIRDELADRGGRRPR